MWVGWIAYGTFAQSTIDNSSLPKRGISMISHMMSWPTYMCLDIEIPFSGWGILKIVLFPNKTLNGSVGLFSYFDSLLWGLGSTDSVQHGESMMWYAHRSFKLWLIHCKLLRMKSEILSTFDWFTVKWVMLQNRYGVWCTCSIDQGERIDSAHIHGLSL